MSDAPTTTAADVLAGTDLTGTHTLVTGATTGIGKETARALLAAGATVTITARSDAKGAAAVEALRAAVPDAAVGYGVLELASLASVRAFADGFTAEHDRLDLLIANAGVMAMPFGLTEDGFEAHLGTNHLGHFVLMARLLPLLVASAPARVVLLSSGGHLASDIRWDDPNFARGDFVKMEAYGQSKTANILHAVELERRYGPLGVHAYAVHPGMVRTDLGRHFTADDLEDLKERARRRGGTGGGPGGLPVTVGVEVGAATSVWAAVRAADADGGRYCADCAVASAAPYATDPDAARRLWSLSESLTGEIVPDRA
ncbi:MAG: SDR family NAD(P)-dependent oxidoreductase [Actinobacteria bacterium]|nr:SDR family NAD(P)-dependent oxidoreductase [Actinomycetota bacterium]